MTTENNHCENCADKNKLSDVDLFKIAKETRDFEIKLFWQRTNYFLLLNSAIGAAFLYFLQRATGYNVPAHIGCIMLAFCGIGAFVCFAWIKICLGSKFWQVHWEQVLVDLQQKMGLTEYEKDIFSAMHCEDRVKRNQENDSWRDSGCDKRYNRCVLTKPSVSRWMFRTACFFFIVWLLAGVGSICIIYNHAC